MSRQEQYQAALREAMKEIRSIFYHGGWVGTDRARARRVARMSARNAVREAKQFHRLKMLTEAPPNG